VVLGLPFSQERLAYACRAIPSNMSHFYESLNIAELLGNKCYCSLGSCLPSKIIGVQQYNVDIAYQVTAATTVSDEGVAVIFITSIK